MTAIEEVYDAFLALVEAKLTGYMRLSDPYRLELNTDSEYYQGFGLRVGSGENTEDTIGCQINMRQNFDLILTRLVSAFEVDSPSKDTTAKALLADLWSVIKEVEKNQELSASVVGLRFTGHNGIEFAKADRDDLMMVIGSFSIRYGESLI